MLALVRGTSGRQFFVQRRLMKRQRLESFKIRVPVVDLDHVGIICLRKNGFVSRKLFKNEKQAIGVGTC